MTTLSIPKPQLVDVDLDLIDPNPWQPRAHLNPEHVHDLKVSILAVGLLDEPRAREKEGRYELAYGHTRVEALRGLHATGQWGPTVTLKVSPHTDEDMAYMAMEENRSRKDLTAAEEISGWAKILREIPGVTVQSLADRAGVDRSTMSKNLAILDLPNSVLDLVDSGQMSVRSAREFLTLQNDNHCHEDQMELVLKDLSGTLGNSFSSKPPDYRLKTVRRSIKGLAEGSAAYGYGGGFDQVSRTWRPLRNGEGNARSCRFDVAAFKAAYPDHIHVLPIGDESGGSEWTCDAKSWASWSARATREANQAAPDEDTAPAHQSQQGKQANSAGSGWWKALKKDPVVVRQVGKRLRAMKSVKDLTEEDILALGTRVQPLYGEALKLPQAAQPEGVPPLQDGGAQNPPMFDFSECAGCVTGAKWRAPPSWEGGTARLVCTNQQAWMDRRSVGMQKWVDRAERQKELDAAHDLEAIKLLTQSQDRTVERRYSSALVVSMRGGLEEAEQVKPLSRSETGWEERTRYDYWPAGATEFAALTGLTLPDVGDWSSERRWEQTAEEWLLTAPADFDWSRALACLQVWQARCVMGMGKDIWGDVRETVAGATGIEKLER